MLWLLISLLQIVMAIQKSTYNICLNTEIQKKKIYHINIFKN